MKRAAVVGLLAVCGVACEAASASDSGRSGSGDERGHGAHRGGGGGFLKGQLHAHSWGSMDSDTPPEKVARWYSDRGFDFLVITDHNHITRVPDTPTMLVLPGIELTTNMRTCDPPPAPPHHCLLHMNGLLPERALLRDPWRPPVTTFARTDLYAAEVEEGLRMGALLQLDHPNFHFAADASMLVDLAAMGVGFVEIANEAHDSMNDGDALHPSTEALWDEALTRGARVLGTATDDAHDYFDDDRTAAQFPLAYTGDRGFVMVRAQRTSRSIREALARGDFYASTGIFLRRMEISPSQVYLEVDGDRAVWFQVIGEHGAVYQAEGGLTLSFEPRAIPSKYVRVRITDATGHHAWTQPIIRPSP
ncbi:MAG: hypothetical protein U0441_27500 [Polyangiaceae bacterium]